MVGFMPVICTLVISPHSFCLGRLLPTDISHRTICYGSVSRSDQSLTKRCHHVFQVYTLFSGLENSQCLGPPKVSKAYSHSAWWKWRWFLTVTKAGMWLNVLIFCKFFVFISDCDSARFPASSYAALHRGRPPERPLNCKKTLHLGTSHLTPSLSHV